MPVVDMTRRLPAKTIGADIDSLNGLGTVEGYTPVRPDASPKDLKASFATMQAMQQKETEQQAVLKAASDAARQAEWEFHNSILSMKGAVRAQFGPDSDEAQSIGYKKKSERNRPRRAPKAAAILSHPQNSTLKARKHDLRAFFSAFTAKPPLKPKLSRWPSSMPETPM
jgi:hypothetical protein